MKTWIQLAQEQSNTFELAVPLTIGETYTISMNSNEPFMISVGDVFVGETVDGSLEFIATNSGDVMRTSYSDISMEFEIKLELGSQTEWSPAPEDGYGYTGDDGAMHLTTTGGSNVLKVLNIVSSFGNMSFESGIKIKNFGDSHVTSYLNRSDQSGAYVASNEYKEIVVSGRVKEAAPNNNIIWQLISANVSEGLDLIVSEPYITLADPVNKFKSVDVYICRGIGDSFKDTLSVSDPVNSRINLYCPPAKLFEKVPSGAPVNMIKNSCDGFSSTSGNGLSDPFGDGIMFNQFTYGGEDYLSHYFDVKTSELPPIPSDPSKDVLVVKFTMLRYSPQEFQGSLTISLAILKVFSNGSSEGSTYSEVVNYTLDAGSKDFSIRIPLNRYGKDPEGTVYSASTLRFEHIGPSMSMYYPIQFGKVSLTHSPHGIADDLWYPRLDDHYKGHDTSGTSVSIVSLQPTRNFKASLNFPKIPQSMEQGFICDILNLSDHPIVLSTEETSLPGTGYRVDVAQSQGSGFSNTRVKGTFSSNSPATVHIESKFDEGTPSMVASTLIKVACERDLLVATWVLTKT